MRYWLLALALVAGAAFAQNYPDPGPGMQGFFTTGGGGSPAVTGTPSKPTFASGSQNPAAQNITVPGGTTLAVMTWNYYPTGGAAGHGIASVTLGGNAPSSSCEIASDTGDRSATGSAWWISPTTGASVALDPAWDASPAEGPVTMITYFTGATTVPDCDSAHNTTNGSVGITLTTTSGDLAFCMDQHFDGGGTAPGNETSWTSVDTASNASEAGRTRYITAAGATQAANSQATLAYSTLTCTTIAP